MPPASSACSSRSRRADKSPGRVIPLQNRQFSRVEPNELATFARVDYRVAASAIGVRVHSLVTLRTTGWALEFGRIDRLNWLAIVAAELTMTGNHFAKFLAVGENSLTRRAMTDGEPIKCASTERLFAAWAVHPVVAIEFDEALAGRLSN